MLVEYGCRLLSPTHTSLYHFFEIANGLQVFIIKLHPSIMLVRVKVGDVVPAIVCDHAAHDVASALHLLLSYFQEFLQIYSAGYHLEEFLQITLADACLHDGGGVLILEVEGVYVGQLQEPAILHFHGDVALLADLGVFDREVHLRFTGDDQLQGLGKVLVRIQLVLLVGSNEF